VGSRKVYVCIEKDNFLVPAVPNQLGAPKSPDNVVSTFFNAVHLLPKDLTIEYWGAKLVSCPGRHLTRYALPTLQTVLSSFDSNVFKKGSSLCAATCSLFKFL